MYNGKPEVCYSAELLKTTEWVIACYIRTQLEVSMNSHLCKHTVGFGTLI